MQLTLFLAWLLACVGCGRADEPAPRPPDDICRVEAAGIELPLVVRETSGLAIGGAGDGTLWTHNDRGGAPVLYSISAAGRLIGATTVTGARLLDWEDVTAAPCATGRCLYIADIGDNPGTRTSVTIYEVPEPVPGAAATAPAHALRARYPDGAHNAEALFALDRSLYIITKGDDGPVRLYRFPAGADTDAVVTLERIREAMHEPRTGRDRVTGAAASPGGDWVVVRTYGALYFYPARAFVSDAAVEPLVASLRGLHEAQGEGVAFGAAGTIWLSSEAEDGGVPRLARLRCTLPAH